ncbi:hypothetical protein LSH36_40g04006 [Paralvinella palmiformis]|uniref:Uncharacterized protein n=1 Tax=Paralvinella palmiformis TaxID=53620 RepID=A0AAD9K893_9ANNE|nr:hypothetical protein LSH36_40g04006 [Paralvinella palmiformis]
MYQLHIPVRLQKLEKLDKKAKVSASTRKHIGTTYFVEGTTANEVCVYITKSQKNEFGLWLLQIAKHGDTSIMTSSDDVDSGNYETVKDSKYVLQDGVRYVALHYSGADVELVL